MPNDEAAAPSPQAKQFVTQASNAFARDVFQPMFERANIAPDDVRQLISEIRHKLDALDIVLETIQGPGNGADTPHPALTAALDRPIDPDTALPHPGANALAAKNGHAGNGAAIPGGEPYDDIGRNQRSRLRELTLLDFMSRDTRAYSLQQLLNALNRAGFDDTSGAVVSQLHRLKKLHVIDQPAGGMYEITTAGLSHLHKLRSSFGSLLSDGRA